MFKKPIKIGAQNQLSGKDRKTIRGKLVTIFHPEAVDMLLKTEKLICNKISGSKMLIYVSEDYPLLVDGTGKEDFFPSIYACTAFEPLAKTLLINEGVEAYIFNGANLMWPGVRDLSTLGNFAKDQVVSIKNSKGQVVAVGAMGCSFDELKKNTDGSGVAVYILHYKGDRLWDMGSKQYPEVILKAQQPKKQQPPKIQQPVIVEKKQQKIQVSQQVKGKGKEKKQKEKEPSKVEIKKEPEPEPQEEEDDDIDFGAIVHNKKPARPQIKMEKKKVEKFSDEETDKKAKKKAPKKGGKKKDESEQEEQEEPKQEVKKPKKGKAKKGHHEQEEQQKKQTKKKHPQNKKHESQDDQEGSEEQKVHKPKKEQSQEQEQKPEKSAISSQIMDQYFKQAFLNVLKLSKIQAELPIDSGRFFSDYMVLARTDGTKLQIKDSSFKKLGRFYEQMAKLKFIEFKPAKEKKGQQGSTITKILWENDELKNYVPTIRRMGEKETEQKEVIVSKEKLKLSHTVIVDYVYKLTDELKKVLLKKVVNYMPENSDEEVSQPTKEAFLSEKELKEKIQKYINDIAVKDKEKEQKKEEKEGKGKERKVEKLITLSYKDNEFIHKLLKKEIQEFEENLEHNETMGPDDSEEEAQEGKKKGKKDKHRKNLFKIQRSYIVNKIFKLAQPYYNISDPEHGLNKFREGSFKGVTIIADKIMNKNVTKIIGLETFIPSDIKEEEVVKQIHGFAHQLQLKFASSATVQNLPGKNAGREIVIQGNFADELQTFMQTEFGLKKDYITLQNKLGKKKKN